MKKLLLLPLVVFALAATSFGRDEYQIMKVQPSVIRTPEFTFTGDQRRSGKSEQWLEVEVEFRSSVEETDELTFKYYILLAGKCLTGEVTHVNIPKGRELHSVMYVTPRTLSRLLGGKTISAVDIQDVGVQVLNKGQLVAEKSFKGQGQWWQQMQQIPGMVVNKNETPFAALYWDRYEAIKSSSAR